MKEIIQWARENVWTEEAVIVEGATGERGDPKTEYLIERTAKIRRENALMDLDIETQSRKWVDADVVKTVLTRQAGVMRASLEKLERSHGPNAVEIVLEAIEGVERIDFGSVESE